MPSEVLVDVRDLVKTFGPLRAVDGLSFQVRRGEIVGLLGVNGAGKTTLMRVLACYLTADGGTATVAGRSIDTDPVGVREKIGYLPENAPLYSEMLVRDFLRFVARMRRLPRAKADERIGWSVEACGLEPKYMSTIGTLSRGYRQRVGLAQAILHDPDLLILDEPTSGLDPIQIIEIRRLIMEVGKTKTVFFSTHIMQEVEAVCNRAIIIHRGKLIADGAPSTLKRESAQAGRVVARLRGAKLDEVQRALVGLAGVRKVEVESLPDLGVLECTLHVASDGGTPGVQEVNAAGERFLAVAREKGWPVPELHSEGVSLEDAFLHFTGHALRHEGQAKAVQQGEKRS
jgi:ABC-2 type transport system ATP-binding protein